LKARPLLRSRYGSSISAFQLLKCPLKLRPEMRTPTNASAGELFTVDNSDDLSNRLKSLHDRTEIASTFDIATGFFEIDSL